MERGRHRGRARDGAAPRRVQDPRPADVRLGARRGRRTPGPLRCRRREVPGPPLEVEPPPPGLRGAVMVAPELRRLSDRVFLALVVWREARGETPAARAGVA